MKKIIVFLVASISLVACYPAFAGVTAGLDPVVAETVRAGADPVVADQVESAIVEYVRGRVDVLFEKFPVLATILMVLSASLPLLGLIANRTANPTDNWVLILINKILQTLTANSSVNQMDVLPWRVMLTNKPDTWPWLLQDQIANKTTVSRVRAGLIS